MGVWSVPYCDIARKAPDYCVVLEIRPQLFMISKSLCLSLSLRLE